MPIKYPDLTGQSGTKTASGYDLDGAAISGTGQITLRTFGETVADGDLASLDQVICTVYKDATNWATILATYTDAATDTLSSVTVLTSDGTISTTDSVDIRVVANHRVYSQSDLQVDSTYDTAADHSDIPAVANIMYLVDTSALASDMNFTLPVAANVVTGDRVGIHITTGDDSYELDLKSGATSDLINGTDHSVNSWSRLFITGETVIFRCIDGSTGDWMVEHDGRIPCYALPTLSANKTTNSGATWLSMEADTASGDNNIGNCWDTTDERFEPRRDGVWHINIAVFSNTSYGGSVRSRIFKDGTSAVGGLSGHDGDSTFYHPGKATIFQAVEGSYYETQFYSAAANVGWRVNGTDGSIMCMEIL